MQPICEGSSTAAKQETSREKSADVVEDCGMPGDTPFVPIQVPFRGGCRDWLPLQGESCEEEFVVAHGARFTQTLVSLVDSQEWTDTNHFNLNGTQNVLRHALACVGSVLQLDHDKTPIVSVLSDGWNRTFQDEDDRSRYWRCRLDFSKCISLSQFKESLCRLQA